MQQEDSAFLEEYRRLDELCDGLLSGEGGVSAYIEAMENERRGSRVPSWDSGYHTLKHLRWVRNRISQESGRFLISEPADLEAVCGFCEKIEEGTDPISLLRKTEDVEEGRTVTLKLPKKMSEEKKKQRTETVYIGTGRKSEQKERKEPKEKPADTGKKAPAAKRTKKKATVGQKIAFALLLTAMFACAAVLLWILVSGLR